MLLSNIVTARPYAIAEPMCTRLRCVSVAPFGRPVVPEVKRIMNGSSSSMATSGNDAVSDPWHVEHRRALDADLGQTLQAHLVTEQHRRLRELHPVDELGSGPPAVEPDDDRPEAHHRELRHA